MSLTDGMLPGPKLQQDVFDVVLRFRKNPVALVANLTEMFSQVVMAKQDRRYNCFLWRGLDLTKPPDVYEVMRLHIRQPCVTILRPVHYATTC